MLYHKNIRFYNRTSPVQIWLHIALWWFFIYYTLAIIILRDDNGDHIDVDDDDQDNDNDNSLYTGGANNVDEGHQRLRQLFSLNVHLQCILVLLETSSSTSSSLQPLT